MSRMQSGAEILLEILATEGVRHIFGNPGTTELPLMDALADDARFHYVLSLHESVSAGMADGYAQVTARPSFVSLHTAAGLGNAMGNLSNSRATRTPIVVTAGQQDQRHLLAEPFLSGPLTEMARRPHEVGPRGAPGRGPGAGPAQGLSRRRFAPDGSRLRLAYLSTSLPGPRRLPGPGCLPTRAPGRSRPASTNWRRSILATPRSRFRGRRRRRRGPLGGARRALVTVAERLGCPVYGTPNHSTLVFPTDHVLVGAAALAPDAAMRFGRRSLSSTPCS
jgi:benzoylformate decarboxylase